MGICDTDRDILKLKSSLWALGHFGSSTKGAELLNSRGAIAAMVSLAQNSSVFSIRATAYYSLGLLATTRYGADCLFKLGWVCTRHDRHDRWPIIEEENWEDEKSEDALHNAQIGSDSERTSTDQPYVGDFAFMIVDDSATDDELMYIESGESFFKNSVFLSFKIHFKTQNFVLKLVIFLLKLEMFAFPYKILVFPTNFYL